MSWIGGLAEWREGDTVYLSVAFTWLLDDAYARARFAREQGLNVVAGGPALFLPQCQHRIDEIATIRLNYPEAVLRHNPEATFASRGCDQNCHFCIVPPMEGRTFTLIPDFVPRPVLCDNNLSGLPADYQDHIIRRYQDAGVRLTDANSGFEPRTFTPPVYERWKPLINAGQGPWRFAYDEMVGDRGPEERREVMRVMSMLASEPTRRKRVYVLIGNEPFAECMQRIREVIAHGCEPHVQPYLKLNSRDRKPWVRFDWNQPRDPRHHPKVWGRSGADNLGLVARWANWRIWKYADFKDYDPAMRTSRQTERYDAQQGLFV